MARINEANRGRVMAAIRGRDTRPEMALRRRLWALGLRGYRCHQKSLPGRPDIAFTVGRVAVFVDGAYWHGHPDYVRAGRNAYWETKITMNVDRDRLVTKTLEAAGWKVLRFWDFEVERDVGSCAEAIRRALHRDQAHSAGYSFT